jgi:hypothetical protein
MNNIVIDLEVVPFFAGFDLAGRRNEDGKLEAYIIAKGALLDEWPESIRMFSRTYTLDKVVKGNDGYEWGEYT